MAHPPPVDSQTICWYIRVPQTSITLTLRAVEPALVMFAVLVTTGSLPNGA